MNLKRLDDCGCPYKTDVLLKPYTSFKVGGYADVVAFPTNKEQLFEAVEGADGEYCILGAGSNVLVSDDGVRGMVISTTSLNNFKLRGCLLEAECGVKISKLTKLSTDNCLGGLEFALGIPGTLGGLVAMNGGCFNKSIGDIVSFVKAKSGVYNAKQCDFSYRKSRFLTNDVIYSVGLRLSVSERDIIEQKLERFNLGRSAKQPTGNSCGSVFLNDGYFAAKLIDQANLKGYKIGGAFVSPKHANFIINENGTAKDIFELIKHIKNVVFKATGIMLVEEVRYIGKF